MNSFVRFVKEHDGDVYNILYNQNILKGHFCSCNTSCVWFNDELLINSRLVNYKKIYQSSNLSFVSNISQTYIFNKQGFDSRNIISKVVGSNVTDTREIKYPKSIVENVQYKGLEDCRFVVWNNKLYVYGTRWDRIENNGCICIYELDSNNQPTNEIIVRPQGQSNCEKNWAAIEDQPFTFVYLNNPMQVVKVYGNGDCCLIKEHSKNDEIKDWIKGSTQVIRYSDDEYMSIVHTNANYVKDDVSYTDYLTAFIFYDNDFNITRMSKWFVFNSAMCEFSCGLAKKGDNIYITYSQLDCTSHLIVVNKDLIEEFIKLPENCIDEDMFYDYYNLAKYYENNNQITASYVLYNYAAQMAEKCIFPVTTELKLECLIKTYCGIVEFCPDFLYQSLYNNVIDGLKRIIERYPNVGEFYYLISAVYKMCADKNDEYLQYKKLGDEHKSNIHNYFFKYMNPNYL